MAAEFEVHVREHGVTHTYGAVGPTSFVDLVQTMLANVGDAECREVARRKLIRRLNHPEMGAHPESNSHNVIHPKSGGAIAAHQGGPVCVCGSRRAAHDIDGQRDDCDGYTEAP